MLDCPSCGRSYPGVTGADAQLCPHCGHESADAPREANQAGSSGFGGRVDPAAALSHAVRDFTRHYGRLLLLWLPAVAVELAAGVAISAYQAQAGFPDDPTQMTTGQQMSFLGVSLPLLLVVYTVRLALWGAIAADLLDRTVAGGGGRLRRALTRPLPLLAGGLVLTLVYTVGLVLFFVPFLVFLHWFLFVPTALADGRGLGAAFEASRRFAKERRTAGFTALVALLMASLALTGLLAPLLLAGVGGPLAAALAGPLLVWLVAPLVPLLPASYWALAAREAAAGGASAPEEGAPPAAPRPGATAAERFRTTKCPQCGTLVPYASTGSPVDVVCPVCGRSGRVL